MLLPRRVWACALSVASVIAFKDTSPYFELSSIPSRQSVSDGGIIRSQAVQQSLSDRLQSCSYTTYVLVSQPSVSIEDFTDDVNSAPHLRRWVTNTTGEGIASATVFSEVLGAVDEEEIAQQLQRQCKAKIEDVDASSSYLPGDSEAAQRVIRVLFPPPPSSHPERSEQLREHDSFLHALVGSISSTHLIIYTTTPTSKHDSEHHALHLYDNEDPFGRGLHVDLKRDFAERQERNASLPLFETYQYFTPAIFTAIFVSVILFLILYVGVSAVAGLEVSYFAFSKEMGPAAQKKQQ